jgi:hypothetical protein
MLRAALRPHKRGHKRWSAASFKTPGGPMRTLSSTSHKETTMLTPREFALALVNGAVLGAATTALAFAFPRLTRRILAAVLVGAALAYVVFAWSAGESPRWLLLELAGVAVYGGMAVRGVRGSPWWLVAGWTLHPLWDAALHYFGPGGGFAPTWWTVPCISWDLVTAGWIALRIVRPSARLAATAGTAVRPAA